jgi:ATP-binding cassette subfamily F protein 3
MRLPIPEGVRVLRSFSSTKNRMLSAHHLHISFGERTLFDDVSFTVNPHDRIGLVGSNGTGKSTLLKIIAGIAHADSGRIAKAHYVTAGYLPQDGLTATGRTLLAEAETAFASIVAVQQDLDEAHRKLETIDHTTDEFAETLEIMGELQHKLEDLDAYRMKSKIERVLMGLGFAVADLERSTNEFSGGWQMRIALAKLLLQEPSILLLDEPTNHLDLDSLVWLEEYLQNYNGAFFLVSHDRSFLDSLSTKTFALRGSRLEEYSGNYTFFEREVEVRKLLLVNQQKNQQQQIKQTQEFIDRFRYKATKARQVQSRIKQLEKIDLVEVESEEEEIRFQFPPAPPSGRIVLELRKLKKSFGDKRVFTSLDVTLERGDKIAIVGVNGAGKSTLSKIMANVEPFEGGERIVGYNAVISYFAQHQADELDPRKEVLQIVDDVAEGDIRKKLRTILGSFLFHGDEVFKKVSVLSGGEKSRLALAKMLLKPANVLILDEPTNHLDIRSKRVLQEALKEYEGTVVIVSHDVAFVDPIVNKVLEVRNNSAEVSLGNISEFLEKRKRKEALDRKTEIRLQASSQKKIPHEIVQPKGVGATRERNLSKTERATQRRIELLEREIENLEVNKASLEQQLADPEIYKAAATFRTIQSEYDGLTAALALSYSEWESLTERISPQARSPRQ